jgi:Na+/H+ antiporter NhaD/arsenite permease-like protein
MELINYDLLVTVLSSLAILIVSIILIQNGFFKWAALTMIFTAESSGKKLLLHTLLMVASISFLFNYYGIIFIITPIVFIILKELKINKYKLLPFLFVLIVVIDLVITNTYFTTLNRSVVLHGIFEFLLVTIVVIFYYWNIIKCGFDSSEVNNPDDYVKDWGLFNIGILILTIIIIAYLFEVIVGAKNVYIPIIGSIILLVYKYVKKLIL